MASTSGRPCSAPGTATRNQNCVQRGHLRQEDKQRAVLVPGKGNSGQAVDVVGLRRIPTGPAPQQQLTDHPSAPRVCLGVRVRLLAPLAVPAMTAWSTIPPSELIWSLCPGRPLILAGFLFATEARSGWRARSGHCLAGSVRVVGGCWPVPEPVCGPHVQLEAWADCQRDSLAFLDSQCEKPQ